MNIRILIVVAVILVSGCASNPMVKSTEQEIHVPASNEAQVIFMRSSFVGSAINASLYEVTDDEIKFIGIMANATKVTYKTNPGKHVFMVVSEAADFLEAELAPGKNYYSIATPRMGAWKARFSIWPIKTSPDAKFSTTSPDFNKWLADTNIVENSEKSRAWYDDNKDSIKKKYDKYWAAWQQKSADELAQRTLVPEDGL